MRAVVPTVLGAAAHAAGAAPGIGHIKTHTHDYVRHGTVTLFAALNYLEGKLITSIAKRHRHQEWLAFLKQIDKQTPKDLDVHLIADNYATHKQDLAGQAPTLSHALHPHVLLLDEPDRALLS